MPRDIINDIGYNYEITGKGEPVVLISGYGGDTNFWKRTVDMLSEDFMIITVDNRGSGLTTCPQGFSIDDMANDIVSLLAHLGLKSAHMLGWSMGSHIAQNIAIRYPDVAKTLILISSYRVRPSRSAYILDATLSAIENGSSENLFGQVLNGLIYTEEFFKNMEDSVSKIRTQNNWDLRGIRSQFEAINGHDTSHTASMIRAPTLSIHGTKDIMVEVEEGDRLANLIPDCEKIRIEGQGHLISPRLYIPYVVDFLNRHN